MCGKFIQFFRDIYRDHTNRVMINFGLSNSYRVHDGLNQGKVFFFLLWRIFYDPLLCEVKHQESICGPSVAKAHMDVYFFTNLVLKKTVLDKQFLYLVLAVLHSIVSYRMQFSFVPVGVCHKCDALIHKGLKLKSGLLSDFPCDTIHYPSFYGLKSFVQIQSEDKVVSLINFVNSGEILGYLFAYRSHDLQVWYWYPVYLLNFPVCIHVSASNNFLADLVHILADCSLSLSGSLADSFCFRSGVLMSAVLSNSTFFKFFSSLWWYGVAFVNQLRDCHSNVFNWYTFKHWKKLDPHGPVPEWFKLFVEFLNGTALFFVHLLVVNDAGFLSILKSGTFVSVCDCLSRVGFGDLSIYINGSLSNLGMVDCRAGAAVFFENIDLGVSVGMPGLKSSTLVKLQAIVLALKCILPSSSVQLFSDGQCVLDACKSELDLVCPDFRNQCWVEHYHVANLIYGKNLRVGWHKMKGHLGVLSNEQANKIACSTSLSNWFFSYCLSEHFLVTNGDTISGNSRHFVCDVFHSVCQAHWEVESGSKFLAHDLISEIDWLCSSLVWHPDLHMATSFTSKPSANARFYFLKVLHHQLPVAI
ncbi:hypothetical protein G9A89_011252 [Geosiphon pyriformis]|nr:hypothetical protein G9A89_011252 [Geosiphon pyriformis]